MAFTIELNQIKNVTLDLDILADQKLDGLEVTEYNKQTVVVNLPQAQINEGSLISLDGKLRFHNKDWNFSATGQVSSCEVSPSGKIARLEIQLRQIDNELWDQFVRAGKKEQDRVDHLFYSIKGER